MDHGRILILGQTKENSYEIRNLFDQRHYELEIALSSEVGKQVLSTRVMDLLIVHTEALGEAQTEFFEFLEHQGLTVPVLILGEEADKFRDVVGPDRLAGCIEKPYPLDELMTVISAL